MELREWDGQPFDKNIVVLSQRLAEQFRSAQPWAAISVATWPTRFANLDQTNRVGLLQLAFWDASSGAGVFSKEQAATVLDFVRDHWDRAGTFLIHCEAGLSRSPAVAAAVSHVMYGYGAERSWFDQYNLNRHVYSAVLAEHYGLGPAQMSALAFTMPPSREEVLDEPWDVGAG